jgi:hypothetical protein
MKNGKVVVFFLLIAIFCLSVSGCSQARNARQGNCEYEFYRGMHRPILPPANGDEFEIYVAGCNISDRASFYKQWEDRATNACKDGYEITKEKTIDTSPAGLTSIVGRIRCK